MKSSNTYQGVLGTILTGVSALFGELSTNEVYTWISIVLTTLTAVVTIAYTIYSWVKRATADKKVTVEELQELEAELEELKKKIGNRK